MTNVGIANNIGYLYFLWFYRWTTSRNLGLWGAPQLIRETMRWDWPTSGSCSQNSDIQPERPLRRSRNTSFTTWSLSLSRYPVFVYKMCIVTHFFSSFFLPPPPSLSHRVKFKVTGRKSLVYIFLMEKHRKFLLHTKVIWASHWGGGIICELAHSTSAG